MVPQVTHLTCVFGASTPNKTFPLTDRFAVKEVPWHFGQADSPVLVDSATDVKAALPNREPEARSACHLCSRFL